MGVSERKKTIWLIVIFSVLVTAVAWVAPLLGGNPTSPGLGFILWGTAPLLVSLSMRAVTRDWSDLGMKPGIGSNIRWYAFSLVALPLLMVSALLVGVLTSVSSVTQFSLGPFLQTTLTALPVFLVLALFEEVGWRGYLAPKLASLRLSTYVASGVIAVVWATWHLPYIRELVWVYSSEDLVTFIPRFYLVCFALSVIFGGVRSATSTFWSAVLIHAAGNAFGHPLAAEYVTHAAGKEYLGSISNGLFVIVFMLILGIAVIRLLSRRAAVSRPPA